jgi:hypothetical protein
MNNAHEATQPQEIDPAHLDHIVGGGVAMPDARKQEQSEKVAAEEAAKQ